MKPTALKTLFAFVTFVLFSATPFLRVSAQDNEPNNIPEQANAMTLGTTFNGSIFETGDIDWYTVSIPEEGTLKVVTTGVDINDYYIYLYDIDAETAINSKEIYPLGEVDSVMATYLMAGTYYLKIYPYGNNTGTYTLTPSFIPAVFPNDIEPNNTYEQAQTFALNSQTTGRLNYVLAGVHDDIDWFKITTPEEGTLKIVTDSPDNADYFIALVDVDGEEVLHSREVYPITDIDSVYKTNLQAGTYYVKLYPYGNNHGSYQIANTFIPALLANDAEPNNDVGDANVFPLNTETTGRLNYVYDNVADNSDWFSITTPEEGVLTVVSESPDNADYYIALVDVDGESVLHSREVYPVTDVDSVFKTNLQAGTYYVHIYPYGNNHGSYHLRNYFTPAVLANDNEPNNTPDDANEMSPFDEKTGRLNYVYDGVADNADWYTITIPDDGELKVKTTAPDLADYFIRLFDVDKERELYTREVYPLGDLDSVYRSYLQAGKYYIKIDPYGNNHGSYELESFFTPALFDSDEEPNDTFETAQLMSSDTTFTGRINYIYDNVRDQHDWFAITLPQNGGLKVTTGSPDCNDYFIQIIDQDGTTAIASDEVYNQPSSTIYGWDLTGGTTYYVHVYPYGNNFGSYSVEVEFQPAPVSEFSFEQHYMNVLFTNQSKYATEYSWDFGDGETSNQVNPSHEFPGPGAYEVTLTASSPNGDNEFSDFVEFRGIQKIEGTHGGNSGPVTITVYAGGLNAQSQPVLRSGSTEIVGSQIIFPKTGQVQAVFDIDGVALGKYDVVVQNPGEPEMILSQAYTVEEAVEPDVFVEVNGRSRALINRWSTYTVDIGNRGNTDAFYRILWLCVPDSIEFKNLVFDLDVYDDPETAEYLSECPPYWELDTLGNEPFNGRIYGIPLQKIPADYTFSIEMKVKAVEDFEIIAFTTTPWFEPEDFSETMSYNECVAWAIATMIRDKLVEQLTGLLPGADCVYNSVKSLSEVTLAYSEGKLTVGSLTWSVSSVIWTCLKDLGQNIPWVKAMKVSKVLIDITIDIVNQYNADQDCQKYKVKDKKQRRVAAVTSLDPNEIQGPEGYTDDHYIADKLMNYTVFFENQSTAGANAVEVFIYDTLDISKYDPETFSFEKIWISGTTHDVDAEGFDFAMDVDMRPGINCVVRVSGTYNPNNGVAYWHFMSLDPSTMDITEDPDGGFLPPNIDKPEGEGFVSYNVLLKNDMANGQQVDAKATIVFDFNNPIVTNIFSNTLDFEAPVSEVYDIQLYNDELHEVFWQASDYGAGVEYYNIYMSENNGPWELWRNHILKSSDTIRANPEHNYRFFAQAVDYLGNIEPEKNYAEMVLGLDNYGNESVAFRIVPNPASEKTAVVCVAEMMQEISIEVFSVDGRLVYSKSGILLNPGKQKVDIDVSGFAPGIYSLSVKSENGVSSGKMIKR
jgi:hypothetical protein